MKVCAMPTRCKFVMCPDHSNTDFGPFVHAPRLPRCRESGLPRCRGFSLALALFIIVVLGLLATVLYRVIALNQLSVVQETLSTRAFLAAESGAQAAMMRLFPVSGAAASCTGSPGLGQSFSVSGLNGCQVNVICTSMVADSVTQYRLESTGQCNAGNLQASRRIAVVAHNLNN